MMTIRRSPDRTRNPRSFTGGIGPKQPDLPPPTLPLSIMSLPTPTTTQPSSSSPSPSPSSQPPLKSLSWVFAPISNATTCTNITLNWSFFNSTQQLAALYASPPLQSGVQLDVTISGLGSSNVTVPLRFDGSAEGVLGGAGGSGNGNGAGATGPVSGAGVRWFVDVEPGLYDVMAIATASGIPQSSTIQGDEDVSQPIETAFRIHQGDDTSCLSSSPNPGSSSSSSSQSSLSTASHSSAGAIAGGIIGGLLGLALLLAGLLLHRRRRHHAHHSARPAPTQGWNGLSSVGSVNVVEKNTYPFSGAAGEGPFSQIVKEPGSPPGSPASVELAHLPFRPNRHNSTSGGIPDPFATPSPGTPRGGSDAGHGEHAQLSDTHGDALETPNMQDTRYLAPSYSKHRNTPSVSSTTTTTRRASHHSTSRKPVPAYDELDLTSEEREALGEPHHQQQRVLPSYKVEDEEVDGDGMSNKSLPSYKSSVSGGGGNAGGDDEEEKAHAHAMKLLKSLKSKSSGHMKSEGMVHYLIPDPPLEG